MKNKYIITFLLLITLISNFSFSQITTSVIKGKVVDKTSNKPLESANIQVFSSGDSSLVTGMLSDANGVFSIDNVSDGTYTVKISYIGYGTAVAKNVKAGKDNRSINFGTIKLDVVNETTQEIEVVDEAPVMTFEADKKVYDAKKDLTTQSGNAMDVLKNVPSVQVDNDGNVSLRGSGNVKILIDGKPSALLSNGTQVLQNMPANVIDKIEVINNPGAKYEAEGVSGIINIVMKQQDNSLGYNGNIKVNGGTEDKYNLSTGGSYKKGKLSLNGNSSYWNYSLPGLTNLDRTNFTSVDSRYINQVLNWKYKGLSHYGSMGMDYDLDKDNTLSLVTNVFYYERNLNSTSNIDFFNQSNELTSNFISYNLNPRTGLNLDATFTYSKKFKEKGRDLTTFINYSSRNEKEETDFNSSVANVTSEQNKKSNYRFNFANFQADYVHPFSEKSKLETGIKSNARFINGVYSFRNFDNVSNQWLPVPGKDNDANYKDLISAVYGEYSGEYKDFSYKAGLRSELTYIKFDIQRGTQNYNNNYIDFFPSISLSQKIGIENQFQASYSRRINRPNLFFLNPFVDQLDAYTTRSGNPYLEPEYTNSYELGYTRSLKIATLTLSGFYRNTINPVNFVTNVDTNGVTSMKPENVGKSKTYGVEFIAQGGFAKWWTYNGSASYFNTNISDNSSLFNFDKTYNAWSARFSSNAAIPNLFDVQLTYFYFGKQLSAQGEIQPMQMINVAIQKSLFNKRVVLGFRVQDLLNQQKFNANSSGNDFNVSLYQKTHSRAAFFTLTYNFGENGITKSQRTSQRKQRESENEIQQTGN
jgi:outer membrane receptor protein involved in Fe transport